MEYTKRGPGNFQETKNFKNIKGEGKGCIRIGIPSEC